MTRRTSTRATSSMPAKRQPISQGQRSLQSWRVIAIHLFITQRPVVADVRCVEGGHVDHCAPLHLRGVARVLPVQAVAVELAVADRHRFSSAPAILAVFVALLNTLTPSGTDRRRRTRCRGDAQRCRPGHRARCPAEYAGEGRSTPVPDRANAIRIQGQTIASRDRRGASKSRAAQIEC